MTRGFPTLDPELNSVLDELIKSIQGILVNNFVAAYLQGSFAVGDWDLYSDVDFIVATKQEVSDTELAHLQTMHRRIFDLQSPWAQHLDGSYVPLDVLKCHDPTNRPLLYLDNGSNHLISSPHDNTLVVRWVVCEHGITLAGPLAPTLIDPVSADALRGEVSMTIQEWGQELLANPDRMNNRWYQPFVVLSYCRMLHTLETGRVESKRAGMEWAQRELDQRWTGLIQRAWAERPNPSEKIAQKAQRDDFKHTFDFIAYALTARSQFLYTDRASRKN